MGPKCVGGNFCETFRILFAVAMSSGSKQEQLRRLMREQKAKSSADHKRIEHPLAR